MKVTVNVPTRDPLGDFGLDLVEHGCEQVGFIGELVVEGAAGHARVAGDPLGADVGEPVGLEQPAGRGDTTLPPSAPCAQGGAPQSAQLQPPP